jgi:GNAT superfamily N-acetyltransferase
LTDELLIDVATNQDVEEIARLIGEIEKYYGGENEPGDVSQINAALFSDRPVATVLLARENGTVLGMASYNFLWPAVGATSSLYLKELYVREEGRRQGVARRLISKLKEIGIESGCSRLEWTADADNPAALAFYSALGVAPRKEKPFYRLDL